MGSQGEVSDIFDPANVFGMSEKKDGVSISGLVEPFGNIIDDYTGYQLPLRREIAEFLDVPPDPVEPPPVPPAPGTPGGPLTASQSRTEMEKADKLRRYKTLRASKLTQQRTILSANETLGSDDKLG